jgi:two-component system, NtrC family, sensor kinase
LIEKNAEIEAQREELQQNHEELESTVDNLKNTQNQLIQAEKMSSLGQLTAGIAHEINNPINFVYAGSNTLEQLLFDMKEVVKAYHFLEENANDEGQRALALTALKNLKEELEYEELQIDIMALIKDIRTGAERTADIIKNLKNFSRTDEGQFIQADIESGIDSTIMLLTNKIPHGVVIEKKYGQIPPINCMASQLNQVFMNIIGNAIDAINAPGRVTITTIDHTGYIEVHIADTGHGMTDEVKRKLFDPFFTTKPIGKGTGLGMSVVYNIIDKHKGTIVVESEENQGTTFIIKLPKGLGSEE